MVDDRTARVRKLEQALREIAERSSRETASLRGELARVQRVIELDQRIHEAEQRVVAETAGFRDELVRIQSEERSPPKGVPPAVTATSVVPAGPQDPRLATYLLQYQLPTLLFMLLIAALSWGYFYFIKLCYFFFAIPLSAILFISSLFAYHLESRRVCDETTHPPSLRLTLLRHQLCALLLTQLTILYLYGSFYIVSSIANTTSGIPIPPTVDKFFVYYGVMTAGYWVVVFAPLLLPTLRAHRRHKRAQEQSTKSLAPVAASPSPASAEV